MSRGILLALFGVMCLLLTDCKVQVSTEEQLVLRYSEGIQSYHEETYESFFLACNPSEEKKTLRSRLKEHEEWRRTGSVTFSPDGIEIIKIGTLGRGAFFKVLESTQSEETLRFKTTLRPGYASMNYTIFPEGAIVYVLGDPFGSALAIKVGDQEGPARRVVWSVDLEWVWTKRPSNDLGWCLLSLRPLADSAVYQEIRLREAEPGPEPEIPATF